LEVEAVPTLYDTTRDTKALAIEDTVRDGVPYRLVITLKKLGTVTMLDYFISREEAEGIIKALSGSADQV